MPWSQAALPGIRIDWSQAAPTGGDVFQQYNVKRRVWDTVPWTRIAVIPDLTNTEYVDYTPQSGQVYEYTATWTANRSGALYESAPDDVAVGIVTFTGTFLHDATAGGVNALASYVQLRGNELTIEPKQGQSLVSVWGRAAPTPVIGTSQYRHVTYRTTSQDPTYPQMWTLIEALQAAQANGAPLCFRTGHLNDRFFATISKLTREGPPFEYLITLELDQINFLEAA